MGRPKKKIDGTPALAAQPEVQASAGDRATGPTLQEDRAAGPTLQTLQPDVALAEYLFQGEPWHCTRFDRLRAEFDSLTAAELPRFHELLREPARGWTILRRLFGLAPVTPGMDTDLDDLRRWDRAELCAALGLSEKQLRDELEVLRGRWRAVQVRSAE